MVMSSWRPMRKASGGRYKPFRGKRLSDKRNNPVMTGLGKQKKIMVRTPGGNQKEKLLKAEIAHIFDPKQKKHLNAKIITILESPANRNYVRRNIMTKGTIVNTDAGKARITSRPGQTGIVEAVLV